MNRYNNSTNNLNDSLNNDISNGISSNSNSNFNIPIPMLNSYELQNNFSNYNATSMMMHPQHLNPGISIDGFSALPLTQSIPSSTYMQGDPSYQSNMYSSSFTYPSLGSYYPRPIQSSALPQQFQQSSIQSQTRTLDSYNNVQSGANSNTPSSDSNQSNVNNLGFGNLSGLNDGSQNMSEVNNQNIPQDVFGFPIRSEQSSANRVIPSSQYMKLSNSQSSSNIGQTNNGNSMSSRDDLMMNMIPSLPGTELQQQALNDWMPTDSQLDYWSSWNNLSGMNFYDNRYMNRNSIPTSSSMYLPSNMSSSRPINTSIDLPRLEMAMPSQQEGIKITKKDYPTINSNQLPDFDTDFSFGFPDDVEGTSKVNEVFLMERPKARLEPLDRTSGSDTFVKPTPSFGNAQKRKVSPALLKGRTSSVKHKKSPTTSQTHPKPVPSLDQPKCTTNNKSITKKDETKSIVKPKPTAIIVPARPSKKKTKTKSTPIAAPILNNAMQMKQPNYEMKSQIAEFKARLRTALAIDVVEYAKVAKQKEEQETIDKMVVNPSSTNIKAKVQSISVVDKDKENEGKVEIKSERYEKLELEQSPLYQSNLFIDNIQAWLKEKSLTMMDLSQMINEPYTRIIKWSRGFNDIKLSMKIESFINTEDPLVDKKNGDISSLIQIISKKEVLAEDPVTDIVKEWEESNVSLNDRNKLIESFNMMVKSSINHWKSDCIGKKKNMINEKGQMMLEDATLADIVTEISKILNIFSQSSSLASDFQKYSKTLDGIRQSFQSIVSSVMILFPKRVEKVEIIHLDNIIQCLSILDAITIQLCVDSNSINHWHSRILSELVSVIALAWCQCFSSFQYKETSLVQIQLEEIFQFYHSRLYLCMYQLYANEYKYYLSPAIPILKVALTDSSNQILHPTEYISNRLSDHNTISSNLMSGLCPCPSGSLTLSLSPPKLSIPIHSFDK